MCKTENTQIQDVTKNQSLGLAKYNTNPSGRFTPTRLHRLQAWYHLIVAPDPTADLPLQSNEENLAEK